MKSSTPPESEDPAVGASEESAISQDAEGPAAALEAESCAVAQDGAPDGAGAAESAIPLDSEDPMAALEVEGSGVARENGAPETAAEVEGSAVTQPPEEPAVEPAPAGPVAAAPPTDAIPPPESEFSVQASPPPEAEIRTHGSASADREWYPVIEALRGIAAVAVVVDHCWALGNGDANLGFGIIQGLGNWGVNIFFLLSGYLLADYFWQKGRRPSVREFYVRRFFRIAPAYYVVVGVLFVFFADHTLLFSGLGARQIIANATFTQWLQPGTSSNLNVDGSLWTLTIEMTLYVSMPVLAWIVGRWPILGSAALIGAGLGYRVYVARAGTGLEHLWFGTVSTPPEGVERLFMARQFPGIVPLFVLGMAARKVVLSPRVNRWLRRPSRRPSLAIVCILLIPSLVMLKMVQRASDFDHWIWFSAYDLAMCVVALPVFVYASRPVRARLGIPMRGALWMGERSYGLYLWHFPVILSVYGMGAMESSPNLSYLPIRILIISVVSLLLADGSYRMVELPARQYGRKLAKAVRGRETRKAAASAPAVGAS